MKNLAKITLELILLVLFTSSAMAQLPELSLPQLSVALPPLLDFLEEHQVIIRLHLRVVSTTIKRLILM